MSWTEKINASLAEYSRIEGELRDAARRSHQTRLARQCGTSQSYLAAWVHGSRPGSPEFARRVARALDEQEAKKMND